ncbi:MAG: LacI family transcriptional regulator [Anaerolineaceae bacterium]|jgi:LacI family transcriptional regulator|nr:LacI family transcriptional regulator [Anaerolineaceae bacterium]
MPLTLEDIAEKSGVSRSTVSRVINGDEKVKSETRERVMKVIQEYNFQPNLAARGLAARRTNIIGLVTPAGVSELFTDPYFPQLIRGVTAACNAQQYSVMLWLADLEFERRTINQILHNGLLDGVVVSSMVMDDPIVQSLYQSKMPFVLVGRHPKLDVNYIDVDNTQGGMDATLHLLKQNHHRVATITGPLNMVGGFDRYQGYQKALQSRQIPLEEALVVEGSFTEESGYQGMKKLLEQHPDAVFAASDMMAMGAIRAIREAGLRIPEDVAVVGFDDLPAASQVMPPLTSIRQPVVRMGSLAADMLIDLIHHPREQTQHLLLATELIVRSTCGARSKIPA